MELPVDPNRVAEPDRVVPNNIPCGAAPNPTLYHASVTLYAAGATLRGEARNVPEANGWIEEEFERHRAGRSASRLDALFAGVDAADCVRFLRAQRRYDNTPIHVYRVEMAVSGRHPMALVDAVRRNRDCPDALREIIEEYWQPTREWRFWEHLGQVMTVVEELELPNAAMLAGAAHRYDLDRRRAAQLWP